MTTQKFNGKLKEITENHPNIDIAGFLLDELKLPLFKAEALATRIEKEYLQKCQNGKQKRPNFLLEKTSATDDVHQLDYLSRKEFVDLLKWILEQSKYEVQKENEANSGIDLLVSKNQEKQVFLARKYPKSYRITESIVKLAQETNRKNGCKKAIVASTTFFTQEARKDAENSGIELWDKEVLMKKIAEAKQIAILDKQSELPQFSGSLCLSLLALKETKDFLVEEKTDGKHDVYLPGVKYPLLTFQIQDGNVVQCVYRIKYNQPVGEQEGESIRILQDNKEAYWQICKYLEQFLE